MYDRIYGKLALCGCVWGMGPFISVSRNLFTVDLEARVVPRTTYIMSPTVAEPDICKLPLPLLAQVLKHLTPQQRAPCFQVSHSWRAAAAWASSSVTCFSDSPYRLFTLSLWLASHAEAVECIRVCSNRYGFDSVPQLSLPVHKLTALQSLELQRVEPKPLQPGEAPTPQTYRSITGGGHCLPAPQLPLELTALTQLQLSSVPLRLGTLVQYTNLQRLQLTPYNGFNMTDAEVQVEIAAAVPKLQQLTLLHLYGRHASDTVVCGTQHLPHLQALVLDLCSCTDATFSVLPVSLTQLQVSLPDGDFGRCHLNPSTAPRLTQLTALQHLRVEYVTLHLALLSALPQLQYLDVSNARLEATDDGKGLVVLSGLTNLQHLAVDIPAFHAPGPLTAADVAALTASSKLTYLSVSEGLVRKDQYSHLFPNPAAAPRWPYLPSLRELHATMGIMADFYAAEQLTQCCRNLEHLSLATAIQGEGISNSIVEHYQNWVDYTLTWDELLFLNKLTRVEFNLGSKPIRMELWEGLAGLTRLQALVLHDVAWESLSGMLALTSCKMLTSLKLVNQGAEVLDICDMAPPGSPPDVWRNIPSYILQHSLQRFDDVHREHAFEGAWHANDARKSALQGLCRAAAAHVQHVQVEQASENKKLKQLLQQQQEQLQQEQAQRQRVEQNLQRQQQQTQREVAALQSTVAGLEAQVHALLSALQQQQQQQQQQ